MPLALRCGASPSSSEEKNCRLSGELGSTIANRTRTGPVGEIQASVEFWMVSRTKASASTTSSLLNWSCCVSSFSLGSSDISLKYHSTPASPTGSRPPALIVQGFRCPRNIGGAAAEPWPLRARRTHGNGELHSKIGNFEHAISSPSECLKQIASAPASGIPHGPRWCASFCSVRCGEATHESSPGGSSEDRDRKQVDLTTKSSSRPQLAFDSAGTFGNHAY